MNVQPACVLLYLAYGKGNIFNQVLFSLLTLHYHHPNARTDFQIVIYTDKPAFFADYQSALKLQLEILTPQQIEAFKGNSGFIHRVKICIIRDCIEKYKSNVLYMDSDTYFNRSPLALAGRINRTTSIMNSNDYDLQHADELYENEDWLKIRRAIRDFSYVLDGESLKIPLSTRMWNAGVIGIGYENQSLLNQVLDLTDQIYRNKKVFTAEQFAFSYFLQNQTQLIDSGDVILHYWPNHIGMYWKDQYDQHISRFLKSCRSKAITEKAALAYKLTRNHAQIVSPPRQNFTDKIARRFALIWKVARTGKL